MEHATQVGLIKRILELAARGETEMAAAPYHNPVANYTRPERLQRENAVLFNRYPLFVGLTRDAAQAGDYLTNDFTDVPMLIVRGRDDRLRAFKNVCRHRGAKVAGGAGRGARAFSCPYHGWTYGLDGRLIGRPCEAGFAGLDRGDYGLVEIPVAEKHGMIFASPTGSASIDVDGLLGGAEVELAPFGLENYVQFDSRVIERRMNWKLAVDTFLEAYHIRTLHKDTLAPLLKSSPACFDAFGRNGRLIAVRHSFTDLSARPEDEWDLMRHSTIVYALFPNTVFIYQIDHAEVFQVYPSADDPDRCTMRVSLYVPEAPTDEAAREHWRRNFDLLVRVTDTEDFVLCEQIQRGFSAGAQACITFGRNEPGLAHYHRSLAEALAETET